MTNATAVVHLLVGEGKRFCGSEGPSLVTFLSAGPSEVHVSTTHPNHVTCEDCIYLALKTAADRHQQS